MTVFLIVALFSLLFLGLPVALSLAVTSIAAIAVFTDLPMSITMQRMFGSLDSFPLLAIPLFILAGNLMGSGGISKRLINLAMAFIGHIPGGLAAVTILACMIFGAISGSSAATCAAIGGIMIPFMIEKNYGRRFAAATTAVSGELGSIIPPSIPMILYGATTGTSIGALFIAGIVPGVAMAIALIIFVLVVAKRRKLVGSPKTTWAQKWEAMKDSFLALLMPIIILGGIYGGYFTPTEAAAVSVAYAIIIGVFVYKEFTFNSLMEIFKHAALTTATIMVIIAAAGVFSWFLTINMIPQQIAEFITTITNSAWVFLLVVNILLFFVGMFFEASSAILVLAPILFPIAVKFGIDPVQLGMIFTINLSMGMITPPVGVDLFISCKIADISLEEITKGVLPFFVVIIAHLMLVTYWPLFSLWLPNLMK